MQVFNCRIEGDSDLIMNRFVENHTSCNCCFQQRTAEEQAERVVYRDPEHGGQLYIPSSWVQSMLRAAGEMHSSKYRRLVPAGVQVLQENLLLVEPMNSRPVKTYAVDARSVVMPRTRKRVMRYRPRIEGWAAEISLRINDRLLSPNAVKKLIVEGGEEIGLGEMRPQLGGPFGIFALTDWVEVS